MTAAPTRFRGWWLVIATIIAAGLAITAACGSPPPVASVDPGLTEVVHIVATERGPAGGRLVVIDEAGDRQSELTAPAETPSRDNSAAFSPDGRWVVFASTRGRALTRSSVWIVRARFGAVPVRLTVGDSIDLEPTWTADGRSIVFASDRGGGLDLWRIAIDLTGDRPVVGAVTRLTSSPVLERAPSVASDGRIAYAAITPAAGGGATSRIEVLGPGGEVSVVTQGPGDATPSWSPDGSRIAFSGPHARDGGVFDADLWWTAATGGEVRIALDAPGTDEAGPVWSRDGRWLFATSLVRKPDTGEALLSSVVHVDLTAKKPQVRMLVDRAGAVARLAPALAPVTLDAAALTANPDYRTELTRILRRAADRHQRDAAGAAGEPVIGVLVHGGAGRITADRHPAVLAACRAGAAAGLEVLVGGGCALDAVQAAVRALEDEPELNAGVGAVLTRAGTVELDASIMDGTTGRVGAVAAVPDLRRPVDLARAVLDDGEHVLLAGPAAWIFGRERGFSPCDPALLITDRQRQRLADERARRQAGSVGERAEPDGGTVGAVAIDASGRIAAATSTGGIAFKRPGRVGDTPLPGCGTWADAAGGASATGDGEAIIRVALTRRVVEQMAGGADPATAVERALAELVARTAGSAGVIAVDGAGRFAAGHAAETMPVALAVVADGVRRVGDWVRPAGLDLVALTAVTGSG